MTVVPGSAAAALPARYDAMRLKIYECRNVDDAKDIADKAQALLIYARQQRDDEMAGWVAEIRLRAKRQIGVLSALLEKSKGGANPDATLPSGGKSKNEVLAAAGISTSEAHRCEQLAKVEPEVFDSYIAKQTAAHKEVTADDVVHLLMRDKRRAERVDQMAEISKGNGPLGALGQRFPLIYADPPWRYDYAETESRAIENQYPTMSLDEIKALPLDDVAFEHCVLFLWATSPKLEEALEVVSAWGFAYRTCAVWDKQKIGTGYYFRQQHELLLVATRGSPVTPLPANRPSSVFSYPRSTHSTKPHQVYELIEGMYPELSKLELFCRSPRAGWAAWGNQALTAA